MSSPAATTPTTPRCSSARTADRPPWSSCWHALASCLTAGIGNIAAVRGVQLTEVTSTVEGDIDLMGLLGLDPEVRNGCQGIRISFRLRGDDPEALRRVVEQSKARSAVLDMLTQPVPVSFEVDAG